MLIAYLQKSTQKMFKSLVTINAVGCVLALQLSAQAQSADSATVSPESTVVTTDTSTQSAPNSQAQLASPLEQLRSEVVRLREEAARLERLAEQSSDSEEDELEDRADELEDRADELEDRIEDLEELLEGDQAKSSLQIQLQATRDTVVVLSKRAAGEFVESFGEERKSARERGYGGGAAFLMNLYQVDMSPVYELSRRTRRISQRGFEIPDSYELFFLNGGMGYGGVGNGLRLGGGGWGGSRTWYASQPTESPTEDSLFRMQVSLGMGGFLIEKAKPVGNINLVAGGFIGAGSFSVKLTEGIGEASPFEAFSQHEQDITVEYDYDETDFSSAFMMLELHGGFTYSFVNWFHFGADFSAPLFISSNGFMDAFGRGLTNGYVTANGGVRIRFVLGNIG